MPTEDIKFSSFQNGVVLSLPPDEIPDTALSRAYNTFILPQAGGGYGIGPRHGLTYAGSHSSGGSVYGLAVYRYTSTANMAEYIIAVNNSGAVSSAGISSVNIAATSVSVSGTNFAFAQAKNVMYGCSGSSNFVVYRTAGSATMKCYPWGLTEPVTGTFTNVTTSGASQSGTYNFKYTWYSSDLDAESSPFTANFNSAVTGFDAIKFDLTTTNYPPNTTHWHIYVRRQESMTDYYRDADMRVPIATTSTTMSFSETRLTSMLLRAPSTDENDPPPTGLIHCCWHLSRMFATDGTYLYYSKINNPNGFDPADYESVNTLDGQKITHLMSYDETNLVIFKERSVYVLNGTGPTNWQIEHVPTSYGAIAPNAACLANNVVFMWSAQGPVKWQVGSQPEPIFNEVIGPLNRAGVLDLDESSPKVFYDATDQRVHFVYPTDVEDVWTQITYNILHDCWENIGIDLPTHYAITAYTGTWSSERPLMGFNNGVLAVLDHGTKTDMAGNITGANLSFVVDQVYGTTQVGYQYSSTTLPPVRVLTTSKVTVINKDDLSVTRSAYSLSTTLGSTVQTVTLSTSPAAPVGVGSVVVFDMPVAEIDTKVQRTQTAYRRMLEVWADLSAHGDIKAWFGVVLDGAVNCAKTWHATIKKSHAVEFVSETSSISGAKRLFKTFVGKRYLSARLRAVMYYPVKQMLTAVGWRSSVQSGRR